MTILIYGFKPYKNYKKNISERIVEKLDRKFIKIIKKLISQIEGG